jgi:hypothetical protein
VTKFSHTVFVTTIKHPVTLMKPRIKLGTCTQKARVIALTRTVGSSLVFVLNAWCGKSKQPNSLFLNSHAQPPVVWLLCFTHYWSITLICTVSPVQMRESICIRRGTRYNKCEHLYQLVFPPWTLFPFPFFLSFFFSFPYLISSHPDSKSQILQVSIQDSITKIKTSFQITISAHQITSYVNLIHLIRFAQQHNKIHNTSS